MPVESKLSVRAIEVAVSLVTLSFVVGLFAIPSVLLSRHSLNTHIATAIGIVIWVAPTVLGIIAVYHLITGPRRPVLYATGTLGIVTIVIVLTNVRTVVTTPGMFVYAGQGTFWGPLIALFAASVLGAVVLFDIGIQSLSTHSREERRDC